MSSAIIGSNYDAKTSPDHSSEAVFRTTNVQNLLNNVDDPLHYVNTRRVMHFACSERGVTLFDFKSFDFKSFDFKSFDLNHDLNTCKQYSTVFHNKYISVVHHFL